MKLSYDYGIIKTVSIAGSSNGRTTDFGSVYSGSNPGPAAKIVLKMTIQFCANFNCIQSYMIKLKRIYDPYHKEDGYRVLVDRLWPRGVSKEEAHLDLWLKEIAPSNELRKWFGHDTNRWIEFKEKYKEELKSKKELISQLKERGKQHKNVTLLYGAKDVDHNEAVVLLQLL